MKTLKYSREALFIFFAVCFGLMLVAALLIILLNIETGTRAYYLCYFLGLLSPSAGAVAYVYKETKSLSYFKSLFKPVRVTKAWFMLLILPLSLISSFLVMSFFDLPLEMNQISGPSFLLNGFLGWASIIWLEELGWRGVLLPILQNRFTPLFSIVITNLIWVLWHLPLLYLIGMSFDQVLLFSLQTFGITSVITWAYNRSRSVLVATLIHAAYNATSGWILTAVPSVTPNDLIGVQALGPLVLGLMVIFLTRGNLGLKLEPNTERDYYNTAVLSNLKQSFIKKELK